MAGQALGTAFRNISPQLVRRSWALVVTASELGRIDESQIASLAPHTAGSAFEIAGAYKLEISEASRVPKVTA